MSRTLPSVVALHDIDDCESFIRATLAKSKVRLRPEEWHEMVCEGLVILTDMSQRYVPQMAGYSKKGSFAGYASAYLPHRLGDAWHRLHPHHVRFQQDGVRHTHHYEPPRSYEEYRTDDNDESQRRDRVDREPSTDGNSIRTPGEFVALAVPG